MKFHSERRFHNGSVGDLCLITVDGEFKRALYVGQTKVYTSDIYGFLQFVFSQMKHSKPFTIQIWL